MAKRSAFVSCYISPSELFGFSLFLQIVKNADDDALRILNEILVYNPQNRLAGPQLLGDHFFDELFDPTTKRSGQPLTLLTRKDLEEALNREQTTKEISSISESGRRKSPSIQEII
ncbi:hypothetical protein AB6A40_006146 [Gnathostoma spinigerum]|uniref:Uncharacterized protein n=1 Tax=Gnathostoma spinigerum TaxID=75299 RepID=A0ABD6EJP5_9BILA